LSPVIYFNDLRNKNVKTPKKRQIKTAGEKPAVKGDQMSLYENNP